MSNAVPRRPFSPPARGRPAASMGRIRASAARRRRIALGEAAAARGGSRACSRPRTASPSFLQELAVGVEPRDLVLVLVGHQLEERLGDRFGEPERPGAVAFSAAAHRSTKSRSARHRPRPGRRSSSSTRLATSSVERLRPPASRPAASAWRAACTAGEVVRREPAPGEGALVRLDGDAVQLDRALDGARATAAPGPSARHSPA